MPVLHIKPSSRASQARVLSNVDEISDQRKRYRVFPQIDLCQPYFNRLPWCYLPGKFDPADFALELAHKDVGLALEVGREFDVPMRLGNLVLEEMTEALNHGWQRRDSRSAMLLQAVVAL